MTACEISLEEEKEEVIAPTDSIDSVLSYAYGMAAVIEEGVYPHCSQVANTIRATAKHQLNRGLDSATRMGAVKRVLKEHRSMSCFIK